MEVKEAVLAGLKELIVPELQVMKQAEAEIKAILGLTNKRLDDMNAHLLDQSRRIDETNQRIDETNRRIDKVHADLIQRIDVTNQRIDESSRNIGRLYEAFSNIYAVIPVNLPDRVARLEQAVEDLKKRLAA